MMMVQMGGQPCGGWGDLGLDAISSILKRCSVKTMARAACVSQAWWRMSRENRDCRALIEQEKQVHECALALAPLPMKKQEKHFYEAARSGNFIVAKASLSNRVDTDSRHRRVQETVLMVASREGHSSVVRELIAAGASLNTLNKYGYSALTCAAMKNHLSIVEDLVNAGADLDTEQSGSLTPLMWASLRGHVEIMKALILRGAKLDTQDLDGRTALILACEEGHIDSVKILLKAGADVDIQSFDGTSALIQACEASHAGIIKELIDGGAEKSLRNEEGMSARDVIDIKQFCDEGMRRRIIKLFSH